MGVSVKVGVMLGVSVMVGVNVAVGVSVGVGEGVLVGVTVGVAVLVAVAVMSSAIRRGRRSISFAGVKANTPSATQIRLPETSIITPIARATDIRRVDPGVFWRSVVVCSCCSVINSSDAAHKCLSTNNL